MSDASLVIAVVPSETLAEFLCEKTKRIAGCNAEGLGVVKALMKAAAGVEEQKEASKREANDLLVRLNTEEGQARRQSSKANYQNATTAAVDLMHVLFHAQRVTKSCVLEAVINTQNV